MPSRKSGSKRVQFALLPTARQIEVLRETHDRLALRVAMAETKAEQAVNGTNAVVGVAAALGATLDVLAKKHPDWVEEIEVETARQLADLVSGNVLSRAYSLIASVNSAPEQEERC